MSVAEISQLSYAILGATIAVLCAKIVKMNKAED
jgi:hypothetical protein